MTYITSPFVGEVVTRRDESRGVERVRGKLMQLTSRLKRFQKALRTAQTDAEHKLWYQLRNRHFQGFKFRRQHMLCGYIVDFVCLETKLIIELDGSQHFDRKLYDEARTLELQKEGFMVLRFWNNDVLLNIEGVLEVIRNQLLLMK
jgi:very-short-patch-repair endonuclease